jgi:diguanylate cyclase (GGDEF)-like protein/PAS domain S-box-containing protein
MSEAPASVICGISPPEWSHGGPDPTDNASVDRRLVPLATALVTVVLVTILTIGVSEPRDGLLTWFHIGGVLAALTAVFGVRTQRPQPARSWYAVAAAPVAWVVGDLLYAVVRPTTWSIADVFYLTGHGLLVAGVVGLSRARLGANDADRLIDVAIATIAAGAMTLELLVRPVLAASGVDPSIRLVTSIYPIADVALVLLLLPLALGRWRGGLALMSLVIGSAVLMLADVAYATVVINASSVDDQKALDVLWLVSYALIAFAPAIKGAHEVTRPTVARPGIIPSQVVLAGLGLLTIPFLVVIGRLIGREPLVITLAVSGLAIVSLVGIRFVRQALSVEASRRSLADREAYYRSVARYSSDVYMVVDGSNDVVDVSVALGSLLGEQSVDRFIRDPLSFAAVDDRALVAALLRDAGAQPGNTASGEVRLRADDDAADGSERWVELRVTNLVDDPAVEGVVVNIHEVTERKRAEALLEYQAYHDSLTGLPNRVLFRDRVEHSLRRLDRVPGDIAVLFCDLDDFKGVNDTRGHAVGDELLREVADRLLRAVRAGDTVARLGGDEFAVLLEGEIDIIAEAHLVADRILDILNEPVTHDGRLIACSGSIGIATAGQGASTSDDLMRNADLAMYGAKQLGRSRHLLYQPAMAEEAMSRRDLESDLRHVLEQHQLVVHYQPLIELDTRRLAGFEALARWQHPVRGLLPPTDFIPIAEETGMILAIGDWVLASACRAAVALAALHDGPGQLIMSINISGRQLDEPGLADRFRRIISESGVDPTMLVLELTESVLMDHPETAAEQLRSLKAMGLSIAIDDFGTGYSSLSYLSRFPVDMVKIDRAFINTITDHDDVPAIIHGLLELGRSLRLTTVAEGIEQQRQLDSLTAQGCNIGQGFMIARPLDLSRAIDLVRSESAEYGSSVPTGIPLP